MARKQILECDGCGETTEIPPLAAMPPRWGHIQFGIVGFERGGYELCPECAAAMAKVISVRFVEKKEKPHV